MTVNVLDVIDTTVNQELLRKIAFQQSEASPNAAKAFRGAVHAILGGLMKRAQYRDGAEQVVQALHGFDSDVLANLEVIVANGEIDSLALIGGTLTDSVFEAQLDVVVDVIQRHTAVRRSSAATLVGVAAPLVFGALGHQKQAQSLNAVGIKNLLNKQRPFLAKAAQHELMVNLGLDDVLEPISEPAPTSGEEDQPANAVAPKPKKKPAKKPVRANRVVKLAGIAVAMIVVAYVSWRWIPSDTFQLDARVALVDSDIPTEDASDVTVEPAVDETITPDRSHPEPTAPSSDAVAADETPESDAATTINVAHVAAAVSPDTVAPPAIDDDPTTTSTDELDELNANKEDALTQIIHPTPPQEIPSTASTNPWVASDAVQAPLLPAPALIADELPEVALLPTEPIELEPTASRITTSFESEIAIAHAAPSLAETETIIAPATTPKVELRETPEPQALAKVATVERATLPREATPPTQQRVASPEVKLTTRYAEALPTPRAKIQALPFGPDLETRRKRHRSADNFYRQPSNENWGFFRRPSALN